MPQPAPTIALFARFPRAGEAKTRLIPALGAAGAADLHRRLVERTLAAIRASGLPFAVWATGGSASEFSDWLGGDVLLVEQGEGDLGARLARVAAPAILLGADIPDLRPEHLLAAAEALERVPVVVGPAADGGYYLLGFNQSVHYLFEAMPWGTQTVLSQTQARLGARNVPHSTLATLHDCDRPEDLARWPDLAR